MTSAAFVIKIEGIPLGITAADLENRWYDGGADSSTMENYFRTCSYGKTSFDRADNIIVDMSDAVMPSTGLTPVSKIRYDLGSRCGLAELYAMMEWAEVNFEKYNYNNRNRSLSDYRRRIAFPPSEHCRWYGVGTYGCDGPHCDIWVREDRWDSLNTLFHEIGHTLRATHSSAEDGWEYGDCSCPMGCAARPACFNAPQSVRQGWSVPVARHDAANTAVGRRYMYTIGSVETTERNTVVIHPDWAGPNRAAIYLSMRSSDTPFTKSLDPQYLDNLAVHTVVRDGGGADSFRSFIQPLGGLRVGESRRYSDGGTNVTVEVHAIDRASSSVTFSFCRHGPDDTACCGGGGE